MRATGLLFILLLRSEPLTSANEPPADAHFILVRDPWTNPPDTVRLDGSHPPENQTAKHIYRGGSKDLLSADSRKQERVPENTDTSDHRPSLLQLSGINHSLISIEMYSSKRPAQHYIMQSLRESRRDFLMNPTHGETCRIVLVMTHFPKVVMGCESPLMRGYQHQLIRDSAAESLICAERDASGLCERDDSGLTPVGSAGRRIAAKLASLQSIVKEETIEQKTET
ncbi:hypothetical protein Q8A67_021908 [Cirrhinus molitorella]|uniref:Uncharacterized protein n=1 Tax=Cirrhinus molitorella TaxID=172907 RepID=A0AA88P4D6_9TELE|nr:hypothetical protein Q8A67_021908 [Cirrhinus molitorella]